MEKKINLLLETPKKKQKENGFNNNKRKKNDFESPINKKLKVEEKIDDIIIEKNIKEKETLNEDYLVEPEDNIYYDSDDSDEKNEKKELNIPEHVEEKNIEKIFGHKFKGKVFFFKFNNFLKTFNFLGCNFQSTTVRLFY